MTILIHRECREDMKLMQNCMETYLHEPNRDCSTSNILSAKQVRPCFQMMLHRCACGDELLQ